MCMLDLSPYNMLCIHFCLVAAMDHSDSDCFFCAIMSHGDVDGIWATDRRIDLESIYKLFNSSNCPTLLGKPKVFLIQVFFKDTIMSFLLISSSG